MFVLEANIFGTCFVLEESLQDLWMKHKSDIWNIGNEKQSSNKITSTMFKLLLHKNKNSILDMSHLDF